MISDDRSESTIENLLQKFHYRLKVQYKGSAYHGWQIQRSGNEVISTPDKRSIQSEINLALAKLCQDPEIYTIGASRTDAGVHALGQVFRASLPIELPVQALTRGLNSLLPIDIRIISADKCNSDFHPRYFAKWKEYIYLFSIAEEMNANPFVRELIAYYPFKQEFIDIEKMELAAQTFQGEHNFINFYCEGSEFRSTIRKIFYCKLSRVQNTSMAITNNSIHSCEMESNFTSQLLPEYFMLRVIGSGFLKQMIRLMVGAIWNAGRGKISNTDIVNALAGKRPKNSQKLGIVAPPMGLYLKEIGFQDFEN